MRVDPSVLLFVLIVALTFWGTLWCIFNARDMKDLGLVLIVLGLLLGWPVMALGVVLVIAYYRSPRT